MKKLLFVFALTTVAAFSQNDKAGIKTLTPNETLEVNGTVRINELPETGVGKIYNGGSTKNTIFSGQKTVVTDGQGNLGFSNVKPGRVPLIMKELDGNNVTSTSGILSGFTRIYNLENDTKEDYYVFDGVNNTEITLPATTESRIIFFYAWGGGNAKRYVFKGTTTAPLKRPSTSITDFPAGVSWNGDELTIQSTADTADNYRYSKIEFIYIKNYGWTYNH